MEINRICGYKEAEYATIGYDSQGNVGVLGWFTNELDAFRHKRHVNNNGGNCKVVNFPKGDIGCYSGEVFEMVTNAIETCNEVNFMVFPFLFALK